MNIHIPHATVEKLISLLNDCYYEITHVDPELWSDFNLIEITRDLIECDYHRTGVCLDVTAETVSWLEAISEGSEDEDMKLISQEAHLYFMVGMFD